MSLGQSPPTTSGIVIVSGSNFFDPQTSDFPVVVAQLTSIREGRLQTSPPLVANPPVFDDFFDLVVGEGLLGSTSGRKDVVGVFGVVLELTSDVKIRSTPVTTSGIVILDMFPGAGDVFVPPVVSNARIFPVFAGIFPEQDRRIFPVLPQFSILTPGD